jgi:PBP1b-binding outer membrane lipoprotein LpoB
MSMKKTLALLSIFLIAALVMGCAQKAAQVEQQADATGIDAAVVAQEQQDLSSDELSDIDAGLGEIDKI